MTADNAAHGIDEIDPGTNGVALKIKKQSPPPADEDVKEENLSDDKKPIITTVVDKKPVGTVVSAKVEPDTEEVEPDSTADVKKEAGEESGNDEKSVKSPSKKRIWDFQRSKGPT